MRNNPRTKVEDARRLGLLQTTKTTVVPEPDTDPDADQIDAEPTDGPTPPTTTRSARRSRS